MIYMWNKPAMQTLIQAVRADVRVSKKFGEHNLTVTKYQTISSNVAHDAMLRYACRHTQTEKDAKLMLSVCSSHAVDEVHDKTIFFILGVMLLPFFTLHMGFLYILMPFMLLIDLYILYAITSKKRRLRRMWNSAKNSGQVEVMYNELMNMEDYAQRPLLLCIPLETAAAGLLIAAYAAWIWPSLT